MKANQKNESGSNNKVNLKKDSPSSPKSPVTGNEKSKHEGEEFIGEGHGHDYSVPVAGEDGGTEDQSRNQNIKSSKNSDKSQHSEQGKTAGENPTI
jgi:hypothetical protein